MPYTVLLCALCGFTSHRPLAAVLPSESVEARTRAVIACIESGDAHKLFPLIPQDERDKENLTEGQLGALLRVLDRSLKGTKPGPLVLKGDDTNLVGIVTYKAGSNVVTEVVVNAQKQPNGDIKSPSFMWNLLME